MNLYDVVGPMAIASGIGGAIGWAQGTHQSSIAAGVVVGLIAGAATFLKIRKAVYGIVRPTERKLALLYFATFFGVLVVTGLAAFGTLRIAENLGR